ncbi:MAG: hypothetical protein KF684_04335 [Phycisphaeraceae bacterium]|nr:hypothetical protein [Phycisphaeraceae bacterium]
MADGAPTSRTSFIPSALFLACSWTWVVGMWLPVILVRHFGWGGWVAFVVPNVVGAMSVGLVYRTREQSEAFVARRVRAMRAFSKVTIALHAFVLTWLVSWFMPLVWSLPGLPTTIPGTRVPTGGILAISFALTAWAAGWALSKLRFAHACIAAGVVWVSSVALLALAVQTTPSTRAWPQAVGDTPLAELAWLAPVLVFGFALCPYLDLTIHRARRETPGKAGDRAFVLGFGALFLAMVAGTLVYAQPWIDSRTMSFYIVAHIALQSSFTIGMHLRGLRDTSPDPGARTTMTAMLTGVALGLAPSTALAGKLFSGTALEPLTTMDGIYRAFMAFYGLLFPALLWTWSASRRDDRRATLAALFCVGLAAPMFWTGFIEGRWFWLAPGLLIALSAPLLARALPAPVGAVSARR